MSEDKPAINPETGRPIGASIGLTPVKFKRGLPGNHQGDRPQPGQPVKGAVDIYPRPGEEEDK